MTFTWPGFLWLMLLIPAFIWLLWRLGQRRERTAQVFADAHLLGSVVRQPPTAHVRWPLALQILALALLLFASSRPVAAPPLPTNRAAIILAIDTSRSMQATDLTPSRLQAAKSTAKEFIKLSPATTKIGLVGFSDSASALVMPTTNRDELLEAIDRLKISQNTSVAAAIVTGVRMLPGRRELKMPPELLPPGMQSTPQSQPDLPKSEDKAEKNPPPGSIVILSDGASNVSTNPGLPTQNVLEIASKFAKDHNVRVYTFPLGKQGGAVVQLKGQTFYIPFEPKTLEQVAQSTGGKNVYPPNADALKAVTKELGTLIRWEATRLEISSLLSGLAVLLMLLAGGLSLRWQRRVP